MNIRALKVIIVSAGLTVAMSGCETLDAYTQESKTRDTTKGAVIGAIAGYLALWTVFQLFRLVTGKEGMGFGDFKLLAAMGAWMGWAMLPQIILVSSVVGAKASTIGS